MTTSNFTIEQVANKINNAKTNATKSKWEIYSISNFSKEDYFKVNELTTKYARENQEFRAAGTYTDLMFS